MMLLKNARERSRFLRYAIVGAIGALVDFVVFNVLISVFSTAPVVASIFSFVAAVISNFSWNRYWTYPDSRTKSVSRQMAEFSIVSGIGLLIRTPILVFLVPAFVSLFQSVSLPQALAAEVLGRNVALAIVIGIVMLWNFIVNRFWTFNDVD